MAVVVPRPPRRYTFWREQLADNPNIQAAVSNAVRKVPVNAASEQTAGAVMQKLLEAGAQIQASKGKAPPADWNGLNRRYYNLAAGIFGNSVYSEPADTFVLKPAGVAFAAFSSDAVTKLRSDAAALRRAAGVPVADRAPRGGGLVPADVEPPARKKKDGPGLGSVLVVAGLAGVGWWWWTGRA